MAEGAVVAGSEQSPPESRSGSTSSVRYTAFISYSHAVDGMLAPALQHGLHTIAKPWYRRSPIRVFRDKTSLTATPQLWSAVERALEASEYFVLLASPEAAASSWVCREVEWWLSRRGNARVLIVVTGGALVWDPDRKQFDPARSDAIPAGLLGGFDEEPLWVDLRWARAIEDVSLRHPRFRDVIADLAAPLRGISKEDLVGEDVRQHRRALRTLRGAIALLTTLALIASAAAWIAVDQRDAAQQQAALATSRQLAGDATNAVQASPRRSLLLALEALAADDTPEARSALLAGLQRDAVATRYLPNGPDADRVGELVFSSDGELAASTLGGLQLWDPRSWRPLPAPATRPGTPGRAAFNPTGDLLAVSFDGPGSPVEVWDVVARRVVASFETTHPDGVAELTFLGGDVVVTGGTDSVVRAWDGRSGRRAGQLDVFSSTESIATSADGRTVAIGQQQHHITVWQPQSTAPPVELVGPIVGAAELVDGLAFTPDGATLLSATSDSGKIAFWDLARRAIRDELDTGSSDVGVLAMDPAGRRLVSTTSTEATVWDLSTRTAEWTLRPEGGPFYDVALSADGRTVTLVGAETMAAVALDAPGDGSTLLRDDASNQIDPELGMARHLVLDVALDPRDRTIAAARTDGSVELWDRASRTLSATLRGDGSFVAGVDFTADGTGLVAGSRGGELSVWSHPSGELRWRRPHGGPVGAVATDSAGRLVVSAGGVGAGLVDKPDIKVWSLADGRLLATLPGHESDVKALAFDPEGRVLASASTDGTVRLWDVETGRLLRVLGGHESWVTGVAFTPDGADLLSLDSDGRLRRWSVADGVLQRESSTDRGYGGGLSRSVTLSPDGAVLYTVTGQDVVMWRTADLRRFAEPLRTSAPSAGGPLTASRDGTVLVGGAGEIVQVWDVGVESWKRRACSAAGRNLTVEEWSDYMPPEDPYRRTCPEYS